MQVGMQCVSCAGYPKMDKTHVVPAFTDPTVYKMRLSQAKRQQWEGHVEQKEQHGQRQEGGMHVGVLGATALHRR